jgi:hypothetical protein
VEVLDILQVECRGKMRHLRKESKWKLALKRTLSYLIIYVRPPVPYKGVNGRFP